MKFDTEAQRDMILGLLAQVPAQGATLGSLFQGTASIPPATVELVQQIQNAEIEQPEVAEEVKKPTKGPKGDGADG